MSRVSKEEETKKRESEKRKYEKVSTAGYIYLYVNQGHVIVHVGYT